MVTLGKTVVYRETFVSTMGLFGVYRDDSLHLSMGTLAINAAIVRMSAVLGYLPLQGAIGLEPAEPVRTRGLLTWAKDLRLANGLTIVNDLSYNV